MRKKLLLVLSLWVSFVCLNSAFGQEVITISGTVKTSQGNPIPSASVSVKGTKKGTVVNYDGKFTLKNVQSGSILVISAIGFVSKEEVASSESLNIVLDSSQSDLNDVIVTGYGSRRLASNVVGSIVTVKGSVLQNKPSPNLIDALQGQVAGLQVYTSTGEPDGSSSFSLNGVGSLGAGSTPLILLDGTPVDAGTLISLNPSDVESLSVLKDASATSIYGSRAANGVIIITTKHGVSGLSSITLSSQYATSKLLGTKFFDRFMNTDELLSFWSETGLLSDAQINGMLNYPNAGRDINTRWNNVYYKDNAPIKTLNLSASGGGEKTSYFVSGGYIGDEGLAYRSAYDKYTLRSNITSKVTNWFKFGINLFFGYDKRQENPYGSNNTNRGLGMLAPPFYSPYDSTGKAYDYIPGWNHYSANYLAETHPSVSNNTQFNPTAYIEIDPLKGLTLRTQAGMDAYDYQTSSQTLASYIGSPNNGSVSESYARGVQRTWTNTIEYQFSEGGDKHNFDILGGQEWIDYSYKGISASSSGQPNDELMLLSNGPNNYSVGESKTEYAYLSFFGKLGYNYLNKYFVDLSIRNDKSSRFGANKKNATFWSIGGMWKAKKEKFLSDVNWLSDLTVRLNYGTQGNSDIGNYLSLPLAGTNTYMGGTGLEITAPGNPDLTWEKQALTTLGLNFELFHRARFDLSAFNRTTTNMLVDVPYPYTSGFSSITSNVGKLNIKGLNVTVDFDVIKTKDFVITPRFNFAYNKEKVLSLFQGLNYYTINGTGILWVIGDPVEYMQPIWAGVNSETGEPQWYLPGDDPSKTQKDPSKVTSDFDDALSQNTGIKRNPPFYGGFGLNATYKGFYLDASFSFVNGKYLINNDAYFYENANVFVGYNQWKNVADYWKNPGDKTEFPSLDYQFVQFDTRLIQNASFLRLKNLTIGYKVPSSVLKKTHILKGANIYLVGRNILTVTNYTGADPEVDSNLQLGNYPNTKQYAVGLDLQF
ncbi:hypothetical protein A9P82_11875 [Arachidicoccus ginsenosidimutans]|uniref:SusC/RagA family TonB-linked outer membrane protein n=1 Tax=Arachidicoccus sp. BS20 TaxID=1850526 RepID=UPI0007F144BA|nr:SusC/RagA family TonB-linked outer membrane protein [Arachidicoccus sp. BS20]ANI89924.1 hypothetical protein A9P82_11875 [Arachidicoccus sp. BS20]